MEIVRELKEEGYIIRVTLRTRKAVDVATAPRPYGFIVLYEAQGQEYTVATCDHAYRSPIYAMEAAKALVYSWR